MLLIEPIGNQGDTLPNIPLPSSTPDVGQNVLPYFLYLAKFQHKTLLPLLYKMINMLSKKTMK